MGISEDFNELSEAFNKIEVLLKKQEASIKELCKLYNIGVPND